MKDGVIADFEVTEAMLRYFIKKAQHRRVLARPRMVIAIPSGITEVEKGRCGSPRSGPGQARYTLLKSQRPQPSE